MYDVEVLETKDISKKKKNICMYPNLGAEMVRNDITIEDIARCLKKQ